MQAGKRTPLEKRQVEKENSWGKMETGSSSTLYELTSSFPASMDVHNGV